MPFNAAAHHCSDTSRLRAKQVDGLAQGVNLPVANVRLGETYFAVFSFAISAFSALICTVSARA